MVDGNGRSPRNFHQVIGSEAKKWRRLNIVECPDSFRAARAKETLCASQAIDRCGGRDGNSREFHLLCEERK